MLSSNWKKNDSKAYALIGGFSVVVFAAVVALGRIKVTANLGFNIHVFAQLNAVLNTGIAVILVGALWAVKSKK